MKTYSEAEVEFLISRFESKKLPKSEWTHEAHLVVAVWYVSKYDFAKATELVRENIYNHNESVGTPNSDSDGYHETITLFWLKATKTFLKENRFETISEACNSLINSEFGKSSYPLDYYNPELLFSIEARHNWVEPDLKIM